MKSIYVFMSRIDKTSLIKVEPMHDMSYSFCSLANIGPTANVSGRPEPKVYTSFGWSWEGTRIVLLGPLYRAGAGLTIESTQNFRMSSADVVMLWIPVAGP